MGVLWGQEDVCLNGSIVERFSLVDVDSMVSGEGRRMVKAFPTLGAPVRLFPTHHALFGAVGVVGEPLWRRDGAVLRRLWLRGLGGLLRLLIFQVHSLVPREGGGVIEPLAAVTAGVALALGVDSLVAGQRRGVVEALVAVVAHVGLVSLLVNSLGGRVWERLPLLDVGHHRHHGHHGHGGVLQVGLVVPGQRRGVVEALVAVSAGVGLASGVDLLVLLQMAFTDKALSAHVAFVLFTRVDPLVLLQGGRGGKTLATLRTTVWLVPNEGHPSSVGLLVLFQVRSCCKPFPALATCVWLLTSVDFLMLFQMPSADKALPALSALVGLVLRVHLHVFS